MLDTISDETITKSCAFVIQMDDPDETLKLIATLFQHKHLCLDNIQMYRYRDSDAMLIIHTRLKKDRLSRITQLLEKLPGILIPGEDGIEIMFGKTE